MECKHEQVKCTDNRFFCLNCGAEVASPFGTGKNPPEAEKASETPKRAVKRTAKKKGE